MPFGDDKRPTWQRLYGVGTKWNVRAFDNFARFAVIAVVVVAALFGVLCLVAWLTA